MPNINELYKNLKSKIIPNQNSALKVNKKKKIDFLEEKKLFINEIIKEKETSKTDIIIALKTCEEVYNKEGKQLEIMNSIGILQNDIDILNTFIEETKTYKAIDGEKAETIRKARTYAINKLNNMLKKEDTSTPTIQIENFIPTDYSHLLLNEEHRIINAKYLTEEEKNKLIEELYTCFENYVGESIYSNENRKR